MKTSPAQQVGGFSLVEVLFALVIVSTLLIAVLGVLSVGTRMVGEAGETSTQGRIAHGLIGELQLADWDKLDEYNLESERYRYYDYQGQEVRGNDDGIQVYTARILLEDAGITLPGAALPNPGLRMAKIFISGKSGAIGRNEVDSKAHDYESARDVSMHSRILVRMNKKPEF